MNNGEAQVRELSTDLVSLLLDPELAGRLISAADADVSCAVTMRADEDST